MGIYEAAEIRLDAIRRESSKCYKLQKKKKKKIMEVQARPVPPGDLCVYCLYMERNTFFKSVRLIGAKHRNAAEGTRA